VGGLNEVSGADGGSGSGYFHRFGQGFDVEGAVVALAIDEERGCAGDSAPAVQVGDRHPGLEGPVLVIESESEPPVAHLELRDTGLFLHTKADIDLYLGAAAKVAEQAMSTEDSLTLIALAQAGWESA
jgi:hypothetical protein